MLAFFVYMLSTLVGLWSTFSESKAELENLKLQYQNEQESIEELKALLDDSSNKQIIEKAARERLGYVYSDEQVFIDISGS
jgi:cell division protein FtsB